MFYEPIYNEKKNATMILASTSGKRKTRIAERLIADFI
jgi:hypothetical protein